MEKSQKNLQNNLQKILALVHDKAVIDQNENWCQGSSTYFEEIHKELDEAKAELGENRKCYLEDELGDVLWDYLNLLKNLEIENKIEIEKVFERCTKKYSERLMGRKNGKSWNDTKESQKRELKKEQEAFKK